MKKLAFFCLLTLSANAIADIIQGIDFPDGAASFADEVVLYNPGPDVDGPYLDSSHALDVPDFTGPDGYSSDGAVSLGDGGTLIVRFTDNSLTTSGDDTDDLWIFEIGGVVETFNVSISTDNIDWIDLGDLSGQPTGIDIDGVAGVVAGTQYSYVRLIDDSSSNQTNTPFGEADIDAIGAISSAPPVDVPEPMTISLLGLGLLGLGFSRKRNRS